MKSCENYYYGKLIFYIYYINVYVHIYAHKYINFLDLLLIHSDICITSKCWTRATANWACAEPLTCPAAALGETQHRCRRVCSLRDPFGTVREAPVSTSRMCLKVNVPL